jgi:mRNA interferase MazF
MVAADRGSVWIVDLGMTAKIRPCLILSIPTSPLDRVLMTVVPHTTSVQGTRFEVDIPAKFLKAGVFDAQQIVTVAQARLVSYLGDLASAELAQVEGAVRAWLNLP